MLDVKDSKKLRSSSMEAPTEATHHVTPLGDQDTSSSVGTVNVLGPTVGYVDVKFSYSDPGGSSHLKPGSMHTATATLQWPVGAARAVIFLRGSYAEYTQSDGQLDDQHLGILEALVYWSDSHTVACDFYMRDNSGTVPVDMWAEAIVLFFAKRLT